MIVELMSPGVVADPTKPDDYSVFSFESSTHTQYLTNGVPHCITFPVQSQRKYVVCIDISTTSLGFLLGDIEDRCPLWIGNLLRSDTLEPDYTTFVNNFIISLKHLIKSVNEGDTGSKIIAVKCEKPFFNPNSSKSNMETYAALKSCYERIKEVTKECGLMWYPCPPPVWKSFYLTPVKEEYKIANIAASNKHYIRRRGESFYPGFKKFGKEDCFDALGLFLHYLTVDYDSSGIIRVTKSYEKSLKDASVYIYPYKIKATKTVAEYSEILDRIHQSAVHLGEGRELKQFTYCTVLSAEDNIKSLIPLGKHVYYSIVPIDIGIIPELYKYGHTIDSLSTRTNLLVVGHQAN